MIRQCTVDSMYGQGPVRVEALATKVCLSVLPFRSGEYQRQRWLTLHATRKLALALNQMADQMEGKT